jgi:hypothetical protein
MAEFQDHCANLGADGRKQVRKALEAELRHLLAAQNPFWPKGKVAVKASKLADESMRAGRARFN